MLLVVLRGLPGCSVVKNLPANAGDVGLIPGSGRSSGAGNGNSLQNSCMKKPMDRGAWKATVHGVAQSWTWLSDWLSIHTVVLNYLSFLIEIYIYICVYVYICTYSLNCMCVCIVVCIYVCIHNVYIYAHTHIYAYIYICIYIYTHMHWVRIVSSFTYIFLIFNKIQYPTHGSYWISFGWIHEWIKKSNDRMKSF